MLWLYLGYLLTSFAALVVLGRTAFPINPAWTPVIYLVFPLLILGFSWETVVFAPTSVHKRIRLAVNRRPVLAAVATLLGSVCAVIACVVIASMWRWIDGMESIVGVFVGLVMTPVVIAIAPALGVGLLIALTSLAIKPKGGE